MRHLQIMFDSCTEMLTRLSTAVYTSLNFQTRRQLRSASWWPLNFPRYDIANYGRCAFFVRRPLWLELTPWTFVI